MDHSQLNTADFVDFHDEVSSRFCARCELIIKDRHFLSALDRDWHVHCLVCSFCGVPLDSQGTCYTKDGQIYCKTDYFGRYGWKRCDRCSETISATELVMRVKTFVYHLNCFSCVDCNARFSPGEQFALVDEFIYCRLHYEGLLRAASAARLSSKLPAPTSSDHRMPSNVLDISAANREYSTPLDHRTIGTAKSTTFYRDDVNATSTIVAPRSGRASKKRKSSPALDIVTSSNGANDFCDRICVNEGGGFELVTRNPVEGGGFELVTRNPVVRQKRMRTSFKHNELRIMKSYFALNHNPDAKDLKQLSAKTGLSKRVLQVWFQNARAKYRRNAHKTTSLADDNTTSRENCRNNAMDMTSQQVDTTHDGVVGRVRPLNVDGITSSSDAVSSLPRRRYNLVVLCSLFTATSTE